MAFPAHPAKLSGTRVYGFFNSRIIKDNHWTGSSERVDKYGVTEIYIGGSETSVSYFFAICLSIFGDCGLLGGHNGCLVN